MLLVRLLQAVSCMKGRGVLEYDFPRSHKREHPIYNMVELP